MKQIPRGPENLICPLHKQAMEQVCHKCPWWVQVRGTDPQSGEAVDQWNCSISWLPLMLIENAQQTRQAGAAIESFRNEMLESNRVALALQHPQLLNGATDDRRKNA